MKELYIAPEAEIVCFAPVEDLAANDGLWSGWNGISTFSSGNENSPMIEGSLPSNPIDGDMAPED